MLHWGTNSEVRRSSRSVDMIQFRSQQSAVAGLVTALVCDTGLRTPSLALVLAEMYMQCSISYCLTKTGDISGNVTKTISVVRNRANL